MNKKNPRISILVPIFNVERYLEECLNSIVNQTLKNIEIICINDGSTDTSLTIIKSFMKNDLRIKLIDKPNSGYGDSMNCGLELACGDYIGIVESDDFADKDMFKILYNEAESNSFPDLLKCNYFEYWTKEDYSSIKKNIPIDLCKDIFKAIDKKEIFFSIASIWAGLYKRSFLQTQNIWFNPTPGASYQDVSFNFLTLIKAKDIKGVDKELIYYRKDNENSSVNSIEKVYCVCDEFDFINKNLDLRRVDYRKLLNALKFEIYLQNYNRIGDIFKEKFLIRMRKEFLLEEKSNLLDTNYFSKTNWNQLIHLLKSEKNFVEEKNKSIKIYLEPYTQFFIKTIETIDKKDLILYGFNDLAIELINIFEKRGFNIEIVDRNKFGNIYKTYKIKRIEDIKFSYKKIILITAINKIFIDEIKLQIKKRFLDIINVPV
jgi:glycosyltransferase involved in cell wall biosynthesis